MRVLAYILTSSPTSIAWSLPPMPSKKTRRNEWTSTKAGGWTRSIGSRGHRVRLFQKRRNGTFYRRVWIPGKGSDQASLRTTDRDEAERLGKALLAALLTETPLRHDGVVTLGELWERYRQNAPSFLDNEEKSRKEAAGRADILLGHFGDGCDVSKLTEHDVRMYEAKCSGPEVR